MDYKGNGIYSVYDAKKYTGLPTQIIRRWILGYEYKHHNQRYHSSELWKPEYDLIDNRIGLSFRDLVELKFVQSFRKEGLSLQKIRKFQAIARDRIGDIYPFCTYKFLTDGDKIFIEEVNKSGDRVLQEFFRKQIVIKDIVKPFLKQLEFAGDDLKCWWPLTKKRQVVLDPQRSFGQPIVNRENVLTEVLAKAFEVNKSIELVSDWFEVSIKGVEDAVEYETSLAA